MQDRPRRRTAPEPDDALRTLLEAFAEQADALTAHLEQVYEEAFIETAGERGRLTLRLDGPPWRITREGEGASVDFGEGPHGRRPHGGTGAITAQYRRGAGQVTIRVHGDGVVVDAGRTEPARSDQPVTRFMGIHRAVVVDASDPLGRGRLRVEIPNDSTAWALPAIPPDEGTMPTPGPGDGVWVLFEDGDPAYPVWLGSIG
jgi:hypothetical protein